MKRLLFTFAFITSALCAETTFPGVENIMSLEEFHNTGLDQLTPQQIAALNSAIVRHYEASVKTQVTQQANMIAQETISRHEKQSVLERFGLPDLSFSQEWKEAPGISGTVTGWVGGNSFKLDNGQIWEGQEPIPFELVNRRITIKPRPNGQFALELEGNNTTIRIRRVK
ncbi:MAG: hypothetical protein K9M98_11265 [Cephaloticoccus sp.]|nr:hypothetical protein [Cephaloticoccus sp.]MCF7761069.1 hypothetical protein [Cephaloticoccus sp.]